MARGDGLFRQWEMIKLLQAHHFGVSTEDIAARIECTKRTVQRDLNVLRDIFPITHEQRDRGKKFWRLTGKAVESGELQLTVTEMLSLFLSRQLLLPLTGTQFGDGFHTAIQKIHTLLPNKALTHFEGLEESFFIKNLSSHDYSGQDKQIRTMNEAILNHNVVNVTYYSASNSQRISSEFHPYGMVLMHASLYCIGFMVCYDEVRTLKVSRIKDAKCLHKTFDKPEEFSLGGHLQGAFGIFKSQKTQKIRVEFTGWAATNVREMSWHPSQKIACDDGNRAVVCFELGNTVEFKRWLLGFGSYATVKSPQSLVDEVRGELKQALGRY